MVIMGNSSLQELILQNCTKYKIRNFWIENLLIQQQRSNTRFRQESYTRKVLFCLHLEQPSNPKQKWKFTFRKTYHSQKQTLLSLKVIILISTLQSQSIYYIKNRSKRTLNSAHFTKTMCILSELRFKMTKKWQRRVLTKQIYLRKTTATDYICFAATLAKYQHLTQIT